MSPRSQELELVRAAQAGDRAAILALVERYQSSVYRFSKRMCPTAHDADDAVQETLLAAVQKLGEFRGEASFSSWLFTIVRSSCTRRTRALNRSPVMEPVELADDAPRPDELVDHQELRKVLDAALVTLEPMYREVLLLRDVEGLTAPEVGELLGLSIPAVKSRLHRARAMLRERVERQLGRRAPEVVLPPSIPPNAELGEILSQYLEGDLSAHQCMELESHLSGSAQCKGMCDLLRRILGEVRTFGEEPPPPHFVESVRRAISATLNESAPPSRRP
jgi:RNA polymerase sigma-70 factor (ECF subfamily)